MAFSRGYGPRFQWRGFVPPAIKTLLIACTSVFAFQTLLQVLISPDAEARFVHYLGLVPFAVLHGYIWQLFTYIFLHGSIWHLLFNLLFLWMFGKDLERTWGPRKFYTYFFLCGIGAAAINVAVKAVLAAYGIGTLNTVTIGASGAIFGILLAMAIVFPHQQVWLIPFPVTLPMRVYVLIMGAIEFYFTLESPGDGVSHVCHLGGMLVGYIYLRRGSFLYNFRNYFSDWKRRRLRKKFEVYVRDHREKPPSNPDNWVN